MATTIAAWVFGFITTVQAVWIAMEWWANRSRQAHLRGIRDQLRALCELCDSTEPTLRGAAERQFLLAIRQGLKGAEANVGAAMGGRHAPK
jgi:hypothetical protein